MRFKRTCVVLLSVALIAAASGCSHEQSDWRVASGADTVEAYDQFVKAHPGSALAAKARSRIAEINEDRDWQHASSTDTADAYRQFLADHPQSKSAQEARIRIENFGLNTAAPSAAASAAAPAASIENEPAPAPAPKAAHAAAHPAAAAQTSNAHAMIQLGAFKTEAQAQHYWQRLNAHFAHELKGSVLDIAPVKSHGHKAYRLRAKVPPEARPEHICTVLKKHKQACVVLHHGKR